MLTCADNTMPPLLFLLFSSGLCRCDDPSHVQYGLKAPAAFFFVLFGLLYPLYVLFAIIKNKGVMQLDQYLHAQDLGDTRKTSSTWSGQSMATIFSNVLTCCMY